MTFAELADFIGKEVEKAIKEAFAAERSRPPRRRPTNHLRLVPGGQSARKPNRRAPGGAA